MGDSSVASGDEHPLDLEAFKAFKFDRVLSESSLSGSTYLLGKIYGTTAIVHLQRTILSSDLAADSVKNLEALNVFLDNRPYFSAHAFLARGPDSLPDLQIKVIWPATEVHIRKYATQERVMVTETPELYRKVVIPYIDSFPPERIEWVFNILDGKKEADRVLFKDNHPETGFLILPDLKWDQTSVNALYLTVLVNTRSIRSLRDLTYAHVPLLNSIREQAINTAKEKFGVNGYKLRMFVHYQPSYYHFHVHIAHIYHEGLAGMMVGQAHLLDDLISLLELSPAPPEESILAKMTFTYPLGVEHKLYPLITAAQEEA